MPFLGKNPTSGFSTIVKDDLTPDGSTTAFTLSKQVASANDIAVFVGNVRQEPTDAYSVNGTTLTMTAAPASGINFYVLHIAGTLESSVVPAAGTTVPGNFGVSGDLTVDTDTLYVDSTNNRVGVGGSDTQLFNGVGGGMKLVVIGNDSATTVANNSDAGIAIVNTNQTAGNLAGLHFARADTDDSPNYAGASIVARFPDAQVTGQYPKGDLAFLTSTIANAAPSEKMRILSSGGITFNGDTASANALDDYEEGTFTPTATPGSGSYTTTELDGRYTKVGRLVAFQIYFKITTVGTGSGGVTISGLPFTSISWYRMPNKWRENQATGLCGQFTMNSGQASGFMQNDDGTNITHASGRTFLINGLYYSA